MKSAKKKKPVAVEPDEAFRRWGEPSASESFSNSSRR